MSVRTTTISVSTRGFTDMLDLTGPLQQRLEESGVRNGAATVFVTGSTAGLTTLEFEPGLVHDLKAAFETIAPEHGPYRHHERWGDDNGHSHVRASLLGPSLVVPFTDGRLLLGTWQQVILVDFDTRPRERSVVVQFQGE